MYNYTVEKVSSSLKENLLDIINGKAKPLGALGSLEDIALKVGLIQNTVNPTLEKPTIVVFAADHGIADLNLVNPYPKQVTGLMVKNFVNGGAAINVFCKENDINLLVVDSGVDFDFDKSLPIQHLKVGHGTKNYLEEKAITQEELNLCFNYANNLIEEIAAKGTNIIGFGEMGIGNSSSAALIMSAVLKLSVAECTGAGTGAINEKLKLKIETLKKVFDKHKSQINTPDDILKAFGGFEIAMLTAAYLKAAEKKMVILVDGFIATSALLLAHKINPNVLDYCIFSHCSNEQGHIKMLNYLNVEPILTLNMRLGEGTGAAIAYPIVKNAVAFVRDMANLKDLL